MVKLACGRRQARAGWRVGANDKLGLTCAKSITGQTKCFSGTASSNFLAFSLSHMHTPTNPVIQVLLLYEKLR